MLRPFRSNSSVPTRVSTSAMTLETAAWVMNKCSAARVMLPCSSTAMTTRSWRSLMRSAHLGAIWPPVGYEVSRKKYQNSKPLHHSITVWLCISADFSVPARLAFIKLTNGHKARGRDVPLMTESTMSMTLAASVETPSRFRLIAAVSIGNALEYFDLTLFTFFAVTIGKLVFPTQAPGTQILLSLGIYGTG